MIKSQRFDIFGTINMSRMRNALLSLFHYPVKILVRAKAIPNDVEKELGIDVSKPIVYLMQSDSITDQLALRMATKSLELPTPTSELQLADHQFPSTLFLKGTTPLFKQHEKKTGVENQLSTLIEKHKEQVDLDVQVVPVFVSWGRAPGKGKPGISDLIADQATPSWLRKLFIVIFLGRDNFISFSKAVSTRSVTDQFGDKPDTVKKLIRVANTHFHRKRQILTGPTLLDRQSLYNSLLGANSIKKALLEESDNKAQSATESKNTAVKYIDEIAADYREGLIRFGDRLLTRIWNKIYNGIHVQHAHRIRELARNGHEIVYVPCHRSHMDYLLLTYVIYHEGMVTPHIAAGINLNFWPVGKIFRRSGAFFLRRSFAGNKLYTAVFKEYLELLFNKGYSVKYYPEGGRSRTGRLLPPKTGMLAMTLQAVAKGVNKPVSIVPVYIGYENVMEVKSYLKELKGKNKKKESPRQILSAIRKLKNYGHGYVNFGEPLALNQFLDEQAPDWRDGDFSDDKKPLWLSPAVNKLATDVMTRINNAAAVNGLALTSLCLLSSKKHTMTEQDLVQTMGDYLALLKSAPYHNDVTIPELDSKSLLAETLSLERFTVTQDEYGNLISLQEGGAVYMTYYRNNILHLFVLPGLIQTVLFSLGSTSKAVILEYVASLYPLLQKESFLSLSLEEAISYSDALIDQMTEQKLMSEEQGVYSILEADDLRFHSAWLLSRFLQETLQRYAVVLTLLKKEKNMSRNQLESGSRKIAERLSTLFGVNSPEFYDKNVLSSFITALKENELLQVTQEGELLYSEQASTLRRSIIALVWPEVAQHLEKSIFAKEDK